MIKRFLGNIKVNLKYYLIEKNGTNIIGKEYINKALSDEEYSNLVMRLYGNQYLKEKYTENPKEQLKVKKRYVELITKYLNPSMKPMNILDAGANKGYLMKAFIDYSDCYNAYGFDILEDKSDIIESDKDIVRNHYLLGSILDIPSFDVKFDIVTCFDVFEHIPINYTDKMVSEMLMLNPKYFVLCISKDAFNDGHITLKGTRFWVKKFHGYRIMTELTKELNRSNEFGEYRFSGIPRNRWNGVPGILFLERIY